MKYYTINLVLQYKSYNEHVQLLHKLIIAIGIQIFFLQFIYNRKIVAKTFNYTYILEAIKNKTIFISINVLHKFPFFFFFFVNISIRHYKSF